MKARIKISKDEFDNWMEMVVTQRFLQYLEEEEFAIKELLASGGALAKDPTETGTNYMEYIHTAEVYRQLQQIEFEQIEFTLEDEIDESRATED